MSTLVVGYQCSFYVMTGVKRSVVVQTYFVNLTVVELVVLAERDLGCGIYRVGIRTVAVCRGVIGIKRHWLAEGLTHLTIVIESTSSIGIQSFYPGYFPIEGCCNGLHLEVVLSVAAQSQDIDKWVTAVGTGQFAIGETEYLNRREAVGGINRGITGILRIGA